jgi:methylthioribose-1-phosphate isomerase
MGSIEGVEQNNGPAPHTLTIRYDAETDRVLIIDQTRLPHEYIEVELQTLADACSAISAMQVRGAPLIGVTAAFGVYLSLRGKDDIAAQRIVPQAVEALAATRPTAVNLRWALTEVEASLARCESNLAASALEAALELHAQDIKACAQLGEHGAQRLQELWDAKNEQAALAGLPKPERLNILTHCNAGSLATVDWGTALAVIYKAQASGIPLHVWVDETRPRNQGASLTCWELGQRGVAHTLIVDNAGGHLMQHGYVDCCVVGSDRTTLLGDVCNKIGTYLKALAASDNGIPFYVALPVSSIDFSLRDGLIEIPIEEREAEEVSHISGLDDQGAIRRVQLAPTGTVVSNYGFDVTPARLVSGLITERGIIEANETALIKLRDSLV